LEMEGSTTAVEPPLELLDFGVIGVQVLG
jgi:hypothetical protein